MQSNQREMAVSTVLQTAIAAPGFSVGKVEYDPFGAAVSKPSQPEWDVRKELRNKLAWVFGTTFRVDYSGRRTAAQVYADLVVSAVLRDHGYPTN